MSTQTAAAPITAAASAQSEREQTARLKKTLLNDIRRSIYVFRIDAGGCNACDIEIFAALTPVFDVERFGIKVVPSPRQVRFCARPVTVTSTPTLLVMAEPSLARTEKLKLPRPEKFADAANSAVCPSASNETTPFVGSSTA